MTIEQLREYAKEMFDNPSDVLQTVLQELIDEQGWLYDISLEEAVQSHSKIIERKLKQYYER